MLTTASRSKLENLALPVELWNRATAEIDQEADQFFYRVRATYAIDSILSIISVCSDGGYSLNHHDSS